MNPNQVQAPAMMPQQSPMQAIMGAGGSAQPSNPQQAAMQGQQPSRGKGPQLPQQPFTPAHTHIYDTLRNTLMGLVKQGVPGMDKVLAVLNNEHVNGIKSQAQQAPQMPQQGQLGQQSQIPPQVLQQLLGSIGGGGGQGMPQQQGGGQPQGGQGLNPAGPVGQPQQ